MNFFSFINFDTSSFQTNTIKLPSLRRTSTVSSTNEIQVESLEQLTVLKLRELAKRYNVNLKGAKYKPEIIRFIVEHATKLKTSTTPEQFVRTPSNVITNDLGYIEVSNWFPSNQTMVRCLSTTRFKNLLEEHNKTETIKFDNPLNNSKRLTKDDSLCLPPILAAYVASYLNTKFDYELLKKAILKD